MAEETKRGRKKGEERRGRDGESVRVMVKSQQTAKDTQQHQQQQLPPPPPTTTETKKIFTSRLVASQ